MAEDTVKGAYFSTLARLKSQNALDTGCKITSYFKNQLTGNYSNRLTEHLKLDINPSLVDLTSIQMPFAVQVVLKM